MVYPQFTTMIVCTHDQWIPDLLKKFYVVEVSHDWSWVALVVIIIQWESIGRLMQAIDIQSFVWMHACMICNQPVAGSSPITSSIDYKKSPEIVKSQGFFIANSFCLQADVQNPSKHRLVRQSGFMSLLATPLAHPVFHLFTRCFTPA